MFKTKMIYIITIADAVLYLFSVVMFLFTKTELALTIWEMLTIVSGPILLFAMLHLSHDLNQSVIIRYAVLGFMTCVCLLTAVAHVVNICVTRRLIAVGVDVPKYFRIGQWPSVEMAVDYLAWGFFMGLAYLCLGLSIVKNERKKNRIRIASIICGCMCLVGFFGALFINENLWYIAPMAYGPGIIVICILAILVGTDSRLFTIVIFYLFNDIMKGVKMLGIYFSGTGNSRYAAELFCREYDKKTRVLSIEDSDVLTAVNDANLIVFAYPVQFSTVPKIMRDFVTDNKGMWRNKKVFVIATMGLFSGDGAGMLGRLLENYGAEVTGGLHLKMPDSIADEKALKRPLEKNKELVKQAEQKIKKSVGQLKEGHPTKEGIGPLYRLAGFWGQRAYFGHKTREYTSKLKINNERCVGCRKCENLCPMNNITIVENKAVSGNRCTMCYRCINKCPKEAITLLGKNVVEQCEIEKYL